MYIFLRQVVRFFIPWLGLEIIFESFTLRVPFSKSYKIHDLESVAILEERDYQDDGEVITGYIAERNKWRLEEFYD